jgi:hypothetical protein
VSKSERLENQLNTQLHGSSIVRAGDLTHVRAANGAVDTSTVDVPTQLRVVPDVVGFKAKFRMKPFGEGNVLKERHVPVVAARASQRVLRHVAEDRGSGNRV